MGSIRQGQLHLRNVVWAEYCSKMLVQIGWYRASRGMSAALWLVRPGDGTRPHYMASWWDVKPRQWMLGVDCVLERCFIFIRLSLPNRVLDFSWTLDHLVKV